MPVKKFVRSFTGADIAICSGGLRLEDGIHRYFDIVKIKDDRVYLKSQFNGRMFPLQIRKGIRTEFCLIKTGNQQRVATVYPLINVIEDAEIGNKKPC